MPPSTMAIKGQRASTALESAANELAHHIGPALEILFESLLDEGEAMPLTETERILLIGRWLARDRQQLIANDRLNARMLRGRKDMIAKRDAQTAMLHDKIIEVRRYFEGTHGPGQASSVLGLDAGIPEDPVILQRYARDAVEQMSEPGFVIPEPKYGPPIAVEQVLDDIVPMLEALEETLDRINPEKRSAQVSLKGKRNAQENFEKSFGRCARYLEALFELAGEDFFAERVRQSSHIVSSTEEEPVPNGEVPDGEVPNGEVPGGESPDGEGPENSESSDPAPSNPATSGEERASNAAV